MIFVQEPDPSFKIENDDFPPGKIPELVLYHEKDVHYDLIVPKDSTIAKEGGLDFQRKHNEEVLCEKQKHNDDDLKESQESKLEGRISKLEGLLKVLEEKVKKLEDEKTNITVESQYNCFECDEVFKTKESIKKHMKNHETENKKLEVECGKCDLKYPSEK